MQLLHVRQVGSCRHAAAIPPFVWQGALKYRMMQLKCLKLWHCFSSWW